MERLLMAPRAGDYLRLFLTPRTSFSGSTFQSRYPDQALTRAQALKGMTFDAAYAAFMERDLGSLAPGKKADFVVIDRDIMTLPITEALNAKVLATVIDGEV